VGGPAVGSSTPMIGVTSVGTGATTPTTATAIAREAVAAGEGILRCSIIVLCLRCPKVVFAILYHKRSGLTCPLIPGLALVRDLAPGPGPVGAATALAPVAAAEATAGMLTLKHRCV